MNANWLKSIVVAGVLAVGTAALAADGSIGVYIDDAGTQCSGPYSGPMLGSVWMNLGGMTAAGITGVEFRIDNSNEAAYSCSFIPDPAANVVLGNPFFIGCNMAFATCQTGTGGRVKLGQVMILESVSASDVMLTVRQHFTPANPNYSCPLATLCDDPTYTTVCLTVPDADHWRSVVNPTGAITADCNPVGVEQTTWSQVKSLFGN